MDSATSSPRRSASRSRTGAQRARDAANRQAFESRYASRLRGRWRWIMLSAAVTALLAALAGWFTAHPVYRATGTVALSVEARAQPLADADGPDPDAQTPPGPARAVPTAWDAAGFDDIVERELDLLQTVGGAHARVRRLPGTLTRLEVALDAPQPGEAERLVSAALAAYYAKTPLHAEAETAETLLGEERDLRHRRAELAAERRAELLADRPVDATAPGDDELHWQAAHAAAQTAQRRATIAARHAQVLLDLSPPELDELLALDEEAAAWFDRRAQLDTMLATAMSPPTAETAELLRERALLEARLQARIDDTRLLPSDPPAPRGAFGPGTLQRVSVRETLDESKRLEAAADEAARLLAVIEPRLAAQRRRGAEREAREQALAADARELAYRREAAGLGGGLVRLLPAAGGSPVPAHGDTAPTASRPGPAVAPAFVLRDPRPARAATGALLGLALGGLLPLGWFLSDRRVRRTAQGELVGVNTPLLCTLPVVTTELDGPGRSGAPATAVDSLDAVRAVVEARIANDEGSFAISGVRPGSGATGISVGLAVSLALAGRKVLLVDLSWLQKSPGTGDDDMAAGKTGLGVDGVMAQLGYLEDEDAERLTLNADAPDAFVTDPAAAGGFTGLLSGANLGQSIVGTRLDRLAVLSALGRGAALRQAWTGRVSGKWLRRLVDVCRRSGYVVVIDAGSAAGGVEGVLTCAAAQGTVLVVSSEETQSDFGRAESRLKLVGARVIGTVLNRQGQGRLRGAGAGLHRTHGANPRGSGLFAAAIEARRGDDGRRAPLPHDAEPTETAPLTPDGVDPVPEPPTQARPTPPRLPPGRPRGDDAAPPEVHVADDVMDQLVDHAIRSAQTHRRNAVPTDPLPGRDPG